MVRLEKKTSLSKHPKEISISISIISQVTWKTNRRTDTSMVTQSGLRIIDFKQTSIPWKTWRLSWWEAACAGGTFHWRLREGLSSARRGNGLRVRLWAATNNVLWHDRAHTMHASQEYHYIHPQSSLTGNSGSKNKLSQHDWLTKLSYLQNRPMIIYNVYTTAQKFGITQIMSSFPQKLILSLIQ